MSNAATIANLRAALAVMPNPGLKLFSSKFDARQQSKAYDKRCAQIEAVIAELEAIDRVESIEF
jgi:hypothetical protein